MQETIMKPLSFSSLIALTTTLLLGLSIEGIRARTKLTTLPVRSMVRIDLKNERHILVEEERTINLQRGVNQVEFAWANTWITKESIQFRTITSPGRARVLNVNYPPGESALYWQVYSEKAGPGKFRISYIINNIKKVITYEATADRSEKKLILKTYFTMKNSSGEFFKNALVQINFGKDFYKTFRSGEAKKMLAAKFTGVPVVKEYLFDGSIDSKNVRMSYLIKNTRNNRMGKVPLPAGKVRIFQEDSSGTEAFLGEDWGAYTPRGEKMKLYLGQAKEVKVKRFVYRNREVYTEKPVKNIERILKYQVENFKKGKVPLTIMAHPGGEWVLKKIVLKEEKGERNLKREKKVSHRGMVATEKEDVNNLRILFRVPPTRNRKLNLYVHLELKNRW